MRIEYDAWSSAGLRPNNEDSYCTRPELGLYAVADGMGGYEGGELASALTVEALAVFFEENALDAECTWPFALLRTLSLGENLVRVACKAAHAAVTARKVGRFAQMGSTVATLFLRDGSAYLGHVGDSRVYRLREGQLEGLTRDHSLHAELLAAGSQDLPDRASCGFGNVITRALGMPGSEPDLRQEPLLPGDLFLLCTDGVTERLGDPELAELLRALPAERPAAALCEEALRRGSRDNVTAVLVRVLP
jgi:serine/threonine protein phosphatase PrpC